jgi:hypothetical protein
VGRLVATLLRSLPQMTDDLAQYFLWNRLNLVFAPRQDEDSPHRSVDGVMPRRQTSLNTTKPVTAACVSFGA